jgi:hypothetical protein
MLHHNLHVPSTKVKAKGACYFHTSAEIRNCEAITDGRYVETAL